MKTDTKPVLQTDPKFPVSYIARWKPMEGEGITWSQSQACTVHKSGMGDKMQISNAWVTIGKEASAKASSRDGPKKKYRNKA